MKRIIDFALNNKLAIWILTIIVVFMGIYSGLNMKQETMPNITLPNISVITTYPGAAPDVVEKDVTVPIEQKVQNISGVEMVSSSSMANASSVQIQFGFKTDMDKAREEVQEALSALKLPDTASDPQVTRLSFDAMPVMALSVSQPGESLENLTETVESNVLPALEAIDGVSDVSISGQQIREATISFKEEEMKKYGLTEETVRQIIQGSDLVFPLGLTNFGGEVKNVVIDGNIASIDDLKKLKIPAIPSAPADAGGQAANPEQGAPGAGQQAGAGQPATPGQAAGNDAMTTQQNPEAGSQVPSGQAAMGLPTVELADIADIKVASRTESISKTNGQESIGIQITKAPDANTVDVVNSAKEKMEKLEKEYGFTATTTMDQGEPIEESVNVMVEKALFGILFAVIVIMLFLRNIRTTLISIISIPLSLLMALFFLREMDITLNILTLGALTVAIGRVIDDSIVVVENIYRRMSLPDERLHGKELIREATKQMFIPIFSSTIVTVIVFLPLGLVGGIVGEMFLPFALAIAFALGASLLVAVTLVPMLAHSLFKKRLAAGVVAEREKHHRPSKLSAFYKRILDWTLNHKIVTFGGACVVLIASLFLIPVIGVSFLPDEEQKMMIVTYSPEPGQTLESAEKVVYNAEKLIGDRKGVETYQFSLGGGSPMGSMMGMAGDNSALFFIEYDKDFQQFSKESTKLVDKLNDETESGEWGSLDFSGMSSGLELVVYGDKTEDIQKAIDEMMPILEKHKDLAKVESSLTEAYDQYTLVANQEKLSQAGLSAAQLGMTLRQAGEPEVLTKVDNDGEELNVYIEVEKTSYNSLDDLLEASMMSPLGAPVKVRDVVEVKEGKAPETIARRDGKMYASLTADILSKDAAGVSASVEKDIDKIDLPKGVSTKFGGTTEQINESFTQLGLAMLAAIAIVYFVLVVTFGGGLAPLAILFSLPFTVIGSLVALWIAREPLSVSAMIGALMLIGIVVTNAIVLIDRVIRNEKKGLTTREALLEAGSTRLRPIIMTALATIGALIPLLFGMEGGGLISKGLGVTVIGGLTSSTLLTLVVVPIVYEVFAKLKRKVRS